MRRAVPTITVEQVLDLAATSVAPREEHEWPTQSRSTAVDVVRPPPAAVATALRAIGEAGDGSPDRSELTLVGRVLLAIAEGRIEDALADLGTTLEAPLSATENEARLVELGSRLCEAIGDEGLGSRFAARLDAYRLRFASGHEVEAIAALATEPDWLDALAGMLGPERYDQSDPDGSWLGDPHGLGPVTVEFEETGDDTDRFAPWLEPDGGPSPFLPLDSLPQSGAGFVPLAGEPGDEDRDGAMAYLVTLHHLEDARTAGFSSHRIGWHELDSELDGVSDLVLSFEPGAEGLLRQVDPESLSLRLFFGEGTGYEEVSTAVGTLYDVEVNPAESRIYLKLRRPVAWAATSLSPAELWHRLSSCVLITEAE